MIPFYTWTVRAKLGDGYLNNLLKLQHPTKIVKIVYMIIYSFIFKNVILYTQFYTQYTQIYVTQSW